MKREDFNTVTICFSNQLDQERQRWKNRPTDQNDRLTANLKAACGVFKTLPKALFDSTDKTYHRPYLTRFGSFKQLSLDDQYRLFFKFEEGQDPKELVIFLVWVNDDTCLHDTFNEINDPSLNQFQLFIEKNDGEDFDYDFHVGKELKGGELGDKFIHRYFEKKNNGSQTQCYLEKGVNSLGKQIYYSDGLTTDYLEVAKEFAERLANEFKKSKYGLEFRIDRASQQKIQQHRQVCTRELFEETADDDYVIFKT